MSPVFLCLEILTGDQKANRRMKGDRDGAVPLAGIIASVGLDGAAPSVKHKLRVGVRVPTELWGAANALAAGLGPALNSRDKQTARSAQPVSTRPDTSTPLWTPWPDRYFDSALKSAPAQFPAGTEGAVPGEPPGMAESMRMRLDFKPSLKRTEVSPAVTLALPTFEEVSQ